MKNHTNVEIDQIIADLVQIDPSLQPEVIKPVILRLLAEKPQVKVTEQFRYELKNRLLDEIENKQSKKSFINFMNKFKYTLSAASAIAIVALIFVSLPKDQGNVLLPGKQQVTRVSDNAFGSLATLTVAGGRGQGGGGGGMGGDLAVAPNADVKMTTPGVGSESLIYQPVNYKFVYKGEEFTIDTDKMAVYERLKGFGASVNMETILKNFNVGSFNIGKFNSARLDYITASQDVDKGYMLSMDLREGNIYIGQNWEKWPNIYANCADESCYQANRIKIDQVPSNESAINIANQFVEEFGIDRSVYGEPYVQDMWRVEYERAADQRSYYVPEAVTVIYPTKIEGNEIYDQSGNKTGLYVSIDIRNNKVSSIGELNSQRYEASDYGTEKDTKRILALAEQGGYQNYMPYAAEAGVETKEVELGKPSIAYVRLWQTANNKTKELFVPSLIFPVVNPPQEMYYRQNVVVPIVKEVLDSQNNMPTIRPMDAVR